MNYGIKVSKEGFDVTKQEENKKTAEKSNQAYKTKPHLLYIISLAYLTGAKKQVQRYETSASQLKDSPVNKVYECLHEASTLFEDLATVSVYAQKCGHDHKEHKLWIDIRNHIRHDVRENFDKENEKRKETRSLNLRMPHGLQTNIGFDVNSIKVGGILVEIKQIEEYLDWAETKINETLELAKEKGYFSNKSA